jgi:peptidoglycan/LPS O-acetylase OafA/YrhL
MMAWARSGPWARVREHSGATASSSSAARPTNLITPLRLGLATIVALSHAFPLTGNAEPIAVLSHKHLTLGTIAVLAFFALSGMLITASGERLSRGRFLWHRFLRLYPAYWVCLAVTGSLVAAIGPATIGDSVEYLRANASIVVNQYSVAGEPFNTPYRHALNGSIWTLGSEAGCYIVVVLFARRRWWAPTMFFGLLGLLFLRVGYRAELPLGMAFAVGAFVHQFRVPTGRLVMVGAALVLAASILTHRAEFVAVPAISVLAIGLGRIEFRWRLPDLSYGTYLYAFPVMQGFATLGIRDPLPLFAVTMAAVLPIAAASWHVIEKPALALKSWRGVTLRRDVPARGAVAAAD